MDRIIFALFDMLAISIDELGQRQFHPVHRKIIICYIGHSLMYINSIQITLEVSQTEFRAYANHSPIIYLDSMLHIRTFPHFPKESHFVSRE